MKTEDPSSELAPYTAGRLRDVLDDSFSGPKPQLFAPLRVQMVQKLSDGTYQVHAKWLEKEEEPHAPLRELVTSDPAEE